MHVFVLLFGEVFLAREPPVDGTGHVEATVADAFYLADFAEHGTNLGLSLIAQMRITHLVEVVCDFNLHVVADALILFDAVIRLQERLFFLLHEQTAHHSEHSLYAFCEAGYLFLRFKHGEFGGLHDTGLNEMQAEFVFIGLFFGFDDIAYYLFNLLDETYQNCRIDDVECRMERR